MRAGGTETLRSQIWSRQTHLWLVLFWLCSLLMVQGEARFPPPEFESDYRIPEEQHPPARSLWFEYADVSVLFIALGTATWFVVRKRSRKAVVGLSIFSLLYFGFYRAGCVCAIGSVQNVALALFDRSYVLPLTVLAFFVAPLIIALFFGRTFCAAVCPHGALQDLLLVKPISIPRWLEQGLGIMPYLYLGLGVAFAATGSAFVICRYDPFIGIFRLSGNFTMLVMGGLFVVAGLFIGRPYCRFLCPFGVLLKWAASVSRWRIRITPTVCTRCQLCEHSCPFDAIRVPSGAVLDARQRARERRRFIGVMAVIPLLMLGFGWICAGASGWAAKIHPDVAQAELYLNQQLQPTTLSAIETLAYARAERDPDATVDLAIAIRRNFTRAGWIFGAFAGLIIGARLARFSFHSAPSDFEPDRGACVVCARCFDYCPEQRTRFGEPTGLAPSVGMEARPVQSDLKAKVPAA